MQAHFDFPSISYFFSRWYHIVTNGTNDDEVLHFVRRPHLPEIPQFFPINALLASRFWHFDIALLISFVHYGSIK